MRNNYYGFLVKSGYWLLEATQCFNQLYVHTHENVFTLSESSMVLLIQHKDLLALVLLLGHFTVECFLLVIFHAFFSMNF
jgi:hypothetical protein